MKLLCSVASFFCYKVNPDQKARCMCSVTGNRARRVRVCRLLHLADTHTISGEPLILNNIQLIYYGMSGVRMRDNTEIKCKE